MAALEYAAPSRKNDKVSHVTEKDSYPRAVVNAEAIPPPAMRIMITVKRIVHFLGNQKRFFAQTTTVMIRYMTNMYPTAAAAITTGSYCLVELQTRGKID